MNKIPSCTPLVLALTDPGIPPNGARHHSILAGLTHIGQGWRGCIKVIWNAPGDESEPYEESTQKGTSVLTWREHNLERADLEIFVAAWQLGAWDVLRCWHQPLGANADPYSANHGLVSLFDTSDASDIRTSPRGVRGEHIDTKKLMEPAAQNGWVYWKFRPTLRSKRVGGRVAARDITLECDGTRNLPYPYQFQPPIFGQRQIFQLGQEKIVSGDKWILASQGTTLRDARQKLGLSADGLANKLRLGNAGGRTVRRWEAGEVPISGPAQVAIELLLNGVTE